MAGHTGRLSAPSDVACAVHPPNAPRMEAAGPNGMVPSPFQAADAGGGKRSGPFQAPGADNLNNSYILFNNLIAVGWGDLVHEHAWFF
jgi:hypothetical protein